MMDSYRPSTTKESRASRRRSRSRSPSRPAKDRDRPVLGKLDPFDARALIKTLADASSPSKDAPPPFQGPIPIIFSRLRNGKLLAQAAKGAKGFADVLTALYAPEWAILKESPHLVNGFAKPFLDHLKIYPTLSKAHTIGDEAVRVIIETPQLNCSGDGVSLKEAWETAFLHHALLTIAGIQPFDALSVTPPLPKITNRLDVGGDSWVPPGGSNHLASSPTTPPFNFSTQPEGTLRLIRNLDGKIELQVTSGETLPTELVTSFFRAEHTAIMIWLKTLGKSIDKCPPEAFLRSVGVQAVESTKKMSGLIKVTVETPHCVAYGINVTDREATAAAYLMLAYLVVAGFQPHSATVPPPQVPARSIVDMCSSTPDAMSPNVAPKSLPSPPLPPPLATSSTDTAPSSSSAAMSGNHVSNTASESAAPSLDALVSMISDVQRAAQLLLQQQSTALPPTPTESSTTRSVASQASTPEHPQPAAHPPPEYTLLKLLKRYDVADERIHPYWVLFRHNAEISARLVALRLYPLYAPAFRVDVEPLGAAFWRASAILPGAPNMPAFIGDGLDPDEALAAACLHFLCHILTMDKHPQLQPQKANATGASTPVAVPAPAMSA